MPLIPGPPPKPAGQRRRRNVAPGGRSLPASGRAGRPPRWPLIPDVETKARHDLAQQRLEAARAALEAASPAERGSRQAALERREEAAAIAAARLNHQRKLEADLWRDLWRLPQAVEWERLGCAREVGQYVRWKVLAELGDLDASREARQMSDRLGLTPVAMLRLRWEVVDDGPQLAPVASITERPRPLVLDPDE
jgi:hypothetical protein